MSRQEAQHLRREASNLPYGLLKVEYFERAARQADFANWDEGSFDIRLELLDAASCANAKVMFPTLAWLLARVDERPDRHDPYLLVGYEYAINNAIHHFPTISLEQINHMLGDFSHRLENHGYSLRQAMDCRLVLSIHLGELDTAAQLAKQISVLIVFLGIQSFLSSEGLNSRLRGF